MKRMAALLRAVNVGGRQVAMAELRRVAAEAGFDDPKTLLASGNLLFGTTLSAAAAGKRLEGEIEKAFGLVSEVFVRDVAELKAVVAANPLPDLALEAPSRFMVTFLDGEPQAGLETLETACGLGERVRLGPGCLYIWFPEGAGKSKLANGLIERRLKVRGTARNWNTVGKLIAALEG
jgi:uncharacterized protein (DUF1697 family)